MPSPESKTDGLSKQELEPRKPKTAARGRHRVKPKFLGNYESRQKQEDSRIGNQTPEKQI